MAESESGGIVDSTKSAFVSLCRCLHTSLSLRLDGMCIMRYVQASETHHTHGLVARNSCVVAERTLEGYRCYRKVL